MAAFMGNVIEDEGREGSLTNGAKGRNGLTKESLNVVLKRCYFNCVVVRQRYHAMIRRMMLKSF